MSQPRTYSLIAGAFALAFAACDEIEVRDECEIAICEPPFHYGGDTGAGGAPGAAGSGAGSLPYPEPPFLMPNDGWLDGESNEHGIQGALVSYADAKTSMGMTSDFSGSNACIAGTTAMVDTSCTPTPPATDCYAETFGAVLALNLNQTLEPMTEQPADAQPYDASSLVGFGFTITGPTPPSYLRFLVETTDGQFCTPYNKSILAGANTVSFTELSEQCWRFGGEHPDPADIIKIAWQVVAIDSAEIPFDFCVSDIGVIPQ